MAAVKRAIPDARCLHADEVARLEWYKQVELDRIAMVEGQRGKGISASDADLLVAYANNLIVLISP